MRTPHLTMVGVVATATIAFAPGALAQTWTLRSPVASPGPLRESAAAFDAANGQVVLFGGWPSNNTTWLYDGTIWISPSPATTPPARRSTAMAYDFSRGVVVMFGGQGAGALGDTWEWNGTNWQQLGGTMPPARVGHSMAHDLVRGKTILFGGTDNPNRPPNLRDTWELDGATGTWAQVATANSPSESVETAMCYDIGRQVCVLYGGTSFFGAPDQKTWEYDGVDWIDRTGAVGPGPTALPGLGLEQAGLVYDPARGTAILHGGRTPNGTYPAETWSYDGSGWTMISSGSPSSRTGFAMAMDTTRDRLVLYGGATGNLQTNYVETWEFEGPAAATYTSYGAGCAGSNGVPQLAPQGSSLPQNGTTFTVELTNLAAGGGFAFLALGFDNTMWNGQTLPFDLTALGLPGCDALVRVDASILLGHLSGTATHSIPIPNGLDGVTFYLQGLSIDAQASNGLGATSDAGTAVIGS